MPVATLKKRADFLRLRGGARFATPSFVLETRPRSGSRNGDGAAASSARFGFTVTKKLGGAVVRNRIRRRLKAAVQLVAPKLAHADHDYVLVGRAAALDRDFSELKKDLERALQRVHHAAAQAAPGLSPHRIDPSARKRP
ncbi:ribonuclease P protein component [Hyphomicrobium sp. CS1GBMeth3]|uniref:ribonuclease P protein component n=1 Tax=Hyphomicrobium sp. CS1GBMeth3 TaxID=1892845 RepID=UPI000931FAC5|nr:ribonuclease P protein component [Hyphomicrobium sp. CS1GBMeth3]